MWRHDECLQTIAINNDMAYVRNGARSSMFHWLHGHEGCNGLYDSKQGWLVRRGDRQKVINPVECHRRNRLRGRVQRQAPTLDVAVQVLEDCGRCYAVAAPILSMTAFTVADGAV